MKEDKMSCPDLDPALEKAILKEVRCLDSV